MSTLNYQHSNLILQNHYNHALWIGDYTAAQDLDHIKTKNIQTVISLTEPQLNYPKQLNINHYHFPLRDSKNQNIIQYFQQINKQITNGLNIGGVLVHCGAGISRSASFVIAYLIGCKGMGFHEALAFVKKRRPQICPNLGFERQLKLYQSSLKLKKMGEVKNQQENQQKYYTNLKLRESAISNKGLFQRSDSPKIFPVLQDNTKEGFNKSIRMNNKIRSRIQNNRLSKIGQHSNKLDNNIPQYPSSYYDKSKRLDNFNISHRSSNNNDFVLVKQNSRIYNKQQNYKQHNKIGFIYTQNYLKKMAQFRFGITFTKLKN